jgi:glucose/arabinose dehydrogenase
MRPLPVLFAALLLCLAFSLTDRADETSALGQIKDLSGVVEVDNKSPDKPVIRIHLGETNATDAALASVKSFPQLQSLQLNSTRITDEGLMQLKGLSNLRRLNLGHTKVTDKGLESLKDLGKLEELFLDSTQVTDQGLDSLKNMAQLRELHVADTRVTDEGLDRLRGLAKLKTLDLSRTRATSAGVEKLRKALPDVKVAWAADLPKPLVTGLKNPESVAVGTDGRIYVTEIGEFDKDGDGRVLVIQNGKAVPFTTGLDDPKGLAAYQEWLFVADKNKVWRIDKSGKAELFAPANAFPTTPLFLNDIAVDPESGIVYVSDSGDLKGKGGAVYRITPKGLVETVTDAQRWPGLHTPNGVVMDGAAHLLMVDFGTGELHRIKLADGSHEKLAEGFDGADGVAWDHYGRLFISSWKTGKVFGINRPGDKPVLIAEGFQSAADLCLDPTGKFLLIPDMKAGTITAIPAQIPGAEVDDTPLPLEPAVAFPDVKWAGWSGLNDKGAVVPFRPVILTHAGDGTNRIFVGTQQGVLHVIPKDPKAAKSEVFLDLQDRVRYNDNTNEEGFLGLTFHPNFKKNGEFFVFYTTKKAPLTNVVSRFKVRKDDPSKAAPASEEVLLRFEKPYWNHDGGTITFGPDGFLYIFHGDGGAANDRFDNGQNLKTLLGKVLRIDVDKKDEGKPYAVPKDNPFVGQKHAAPEIWAYGLRNIWRMAFDRKTGRLWAADVGQNLYEEIDLIEKGGNYGWNRREGLHPFGARGTGPKKEFIEPIWEYHHDVGKSMTGGHVYRGKRLPELDGAYLYGDYVTGKLWALWYDDAKKRVVANRRIKDRTLPVYSFGEDEEGEVYFLTQTNSGQGIFRFVKQEPGKR